MMWERAADLLLNPSEVPDTTDPGQKHRRESFLFFYAMATMIESGFRLENALTLLRDEFHREWGTAMLRALQDKKPLSSALPAGIDPRIQKFFVDGKELSQSSSDWLKVMREIRTELAPK
jgi:type II secretory pathway component PulF